MITETEQMDLDRQVDILETRMSHLTRHLDELKAIIWDRNRPAECTPLWIGSRMREIIDGSYSSVGYSLREICSRGFEIHRRREKEKEASNG